MTAMISLQQIEKRYPGTATPAVDGLSLDIAEGETVVLVGPSGCGKTTTLKMINRLIEPTGGRILIDGTDVLQQDPVDLRRGIGYVIQQTGLMPHRTIRREHGHRAQAAGLVRRTDRSTDRGADRHLRPRP